MPHAVTDPNMHSPCRFRVGGWWVEADLNRIVRGDETVTLEPKILEVLCCLAARPGEVVTREELLDTVWHDRVVVDQVLTRAVGRLRHALGDDPHQPRVIQTIARKGYRLRAPVTPDPGVADLHARRRRWVVALGALFLLAAVLTSGWLWWRADRASTPLANAVAVLPFQMLSPLEWDAPLGDGMMETLLTTLSEVEGLRVIARDSARDERLEGLELRQIGDLLGVDAVVQGSVQRYGDELRVDMRLVNTRDGVVLWSGTAGGDAGDLRAVHDRAAAELAAGMRGGPPSPRGPTATADSAAYREYLFGRHHWNRRTAGDLHKAIGHFEAALGLDPQYAQAYAALSQSYVLLPFYGASPPTEAMPKARDAAMAALVLNPELAAARATLAVVHYQFEYNWDDAEDDFRRALADNPNDATARQWYAEFLSYAGRFDDARREIARAVELDPLSATVATLQGSPDLWQRRFAAARTHYEAALEWAPEFALGRYHVGLTYRFEQRYDEAVAVFESVLPVLGDAFVLPTLANAEAARGNTTAANRYLDRLTTLSDSRYVPPYKFAVIHAGLGDHEAALEWLERAWRIRDERLVLIGVDAHLDPLRGDPGFEEMTRRIMP